MLLSFLVMYCVFSAAVLFSAAFAGVCVYYAAFQSLTYQERSVWLSAAALMLICVAVAIRYGYMFFLI